MVVFAAIAVALFYLSAIPVHIAFQWQTDAEKPFHLGVSLFEPRFAIHRTALPNKRFKSAPKLHPIDALHAAKTALKHLKIDQLLLNGEFGTGDAASTALICGGIFSIGCAAGNRILLRVRPDFSANRFRTDLQGMISVRTGHIMTAALLGAFQYGFRRFKSWISIPSKAL